MKLNVLTTAELFKHLCETDLYDAFIPAKGFMCNTLNKLVKEGKLTAGKRELHAEAIESMMENLAGRDTCTTMHNAVFAYVENFYHNSGEYPIILSESVHEVLNEMYNDWDNAVKYVHQFEQSIRTKYWEKD